MVLLLYAASAFFSDPQERGYKKVWYVDFSRAKRDYAIAYNILSQAGLSSHEIAQAFLTASKRAFPVVGATVGLDSLLLASTQALAAAKRPVTDLSTFLLNSSFRQNVLAATSDRFVREYFATIFAKKVTSNYFDSSLDALQRRSFLLSFPPELRNMFGQPANVLHFPYLIENKISCIFNLANLAEDTARLLACLLLVQIEMALNTRARLHPNLRHPVHIFVEEFGSLLDQSEVSFQNYLNGMRKYGGVLWLLTQTTGALTPGVRVALQNAQTTLLFKLGYDDSKWAMDRFFRPQPVQEASFGESVKAFLFGEAKAEVPDAFAACETEKDARFLLENQQPGNAIIIRDGQAIAISTNIIPNLAVDPIALQTIKDSYAKKLCTPLPLSSPAVPHGVQGTAHPVPSGTGSNVPLAPHIAPVQPPRVQKPQRAKRRVP